MKKVTCFIKKHRILLLSICLAVLRFLIWDYQYITDLILPKHDGLHGITAFATSLHSIRMGGDIAWWNPVDIRTGGWAQYYSGFLSPVAPTYGSILFIITACIVKALNFFSVVIPEYYLYILLNHFITPFLAIYFLLKFSELFCKRTATLVIIGGGYFFTVIGLWTDSWYYWQDQMFMWLILYAVIGLLFETNNKTFRFFCGALICFAASANFWTLHNLLFIAIMIVVYICFRENFTAFLKDKISAVWQLVLKNRVLTVLTLFCCLLWMVLIANVYLEQGSVYTRHYVESDLWKNGGYSVQHAFERGTDMGISYLTVEMFDPIVKPSSTTNINYNYIHYARYLGIALLPCILLGLFCRGKKIKYFLQISIINFMVCLVPGFLLPVWNTFFSWDQHFFYFYFHFFAISLLLLAAVSFEECIMEHKLNRNVLKMAGLATAGAALFCFCTNYNSDRRVMLAVIMLFLSIMLLYFFDIYSKKIWLVLFLLLFLGDVTRYYYESSLGDYECMDELAHKSGEGYELLREPFTYVDNNTFEARIAESSPPVINHMWPINKYLPPVSYMKLLEYREDEDFSSTVDYSFEDGQDLHFYSGKDSIDGNDVFLEEDRAEGEYTIKKYGYNDWELEYDAEEAGFIVLNLKYDRNWEILIDGKQQESGEGNINYLYIQTGIGRHNMQIHYRPFARKVYPAAVFLLLVTLAASCIRKPVGKTKLVED